MPRQARLDAPGTLHHAIIRGIEKRRIVDDDIDRENFVKRFGSLAVETKTRICAWALMDNHAHILLKSGEYGMPCFMRRLLTGHAIFYNLRHGRHGHLFQNRYKSIVCEEDAYFMELVRYIHLNPVRAGIAKGVTDLDRYPWCGHGAIVGKIDYSWMDREYVLRWFGKREKIAVRRYSDFIGKGLDQGNRPELVGGGLIRSMGGWGVVKSIRRHGEKELSDERILGSGDFVKELLSGADAAARRQFENGNQVKNAIDQVKAECEKQKISISALLAGSRNRDISRLRSDLAVTLIREFGLSLAETARQLGISTSAVSKLLSRNKDMKE